MEDKRWVTCCRGRRANCPRIALQGEQIFIQDDDGNTVTLTKAQFRDVIRGVSAEANRQTMHI
jgi:hypothetical protein